jgi:hypothetical protein
MVKGLDVGYVDDEQISGLTAFDVEWTGKIVDLCKVNIANIVCAVIVADLATCPVEAFYLDRLTRFNGCDTRDCKLAICKLAQ